MYNVFCLYSVVQTFVRCFFNGIFIYETQFLRCFTVLFHSYACLAGLGFYYVSWCLFDSTVLLPSLVCFSGLLCVEHCYYCLRRPLNSCCFCLSGLCCFTLAFLSLDYHGEVSLRGLCCFTGVGVCTVVLQYSVFR